MKKDASRSDEIIDETLYGEVLSKQEVEESESSQGIRAQEPYRYFKIDKMKAALKITAKPQRGGRNILNHDKCIQRLSG